jgi:glutaredoxin
MSMSDIEYIFNSILNEIINAPSNFFIIFTSKKCIFCTRAKELLSYNNCVGLDYDIEDCIPGGIKGLFQFLKENSKLLKFPKKYNTIPIIFVNHKFLGGFEELQNYLDKNGCSRKRVAKLKY